MRMEFPVALIERAAVAAAYRSRHAWPALALLGWSALLSPGMQAATSAAAPFCELARPRPRPPGAPKAGDVIMRSLRLHPRSKQETEKV